MTHDTAKLGLGLPIALVAVTARATGTRRVGWIDQHHGYACYRCFVLHKLAQLVETPIAVSRPLLSAGSLDPRTDMRQVFQRYLSLCAFGFRNKPLGYRMVRVRLEAALLPAEGFQAPFRVLRTDRLQRRTPPLIALARAFNCCAAIRLAVAIGADVHDTEVNTQRPVNIIGRWFLNITRRKEVELSVDIRKVGFTTPRLQQFPLALTTHKRNGLPTAYRPNTDRRRVHIPRQDTVIVGNSPVWGERALHLAVNFVRIGNFGDLADNHLCRQARRCLDVVVHQTMHIKLLERLCVPCRLADGVADSVRLFQCLQQGRVLVRRGQQFELGDQLHSMIIQQPERLYKFGGRRFLPTHKGMGFPRRAFL